jgi:hypothetical protein
LVERTSKIDIELGTMQIEASIVAQGLELEPSRVQAMMRKGEITSLCERGMNEDAGRYRLGRPRREPEGVFCSYRAQNDTPPEQLFPGWN